MSTAAPASSPSACQARSAASRSMLRGWPGLAGVVLVDPAAALIAVDAGGRQIAQPACPPQQGRQVLSAGSPVVPGAMVQRTWEALPIASAGSAVVPSNKCASMPSARNSAAFCSLVQVPATLQPAALASLAISRPL